MLLHQMENKVKQNNVFVMYISWVHHPVFFILAASVCDAPGAGGCDAFAEQQVKQQRFCSIYI